MTNTELMANVAALEAPYRSVHPHRGHLPRRSAHQPREHHGSRRGWSGQAHWRTCSPHRGRLVRGHAHRGAR